MVMRRGEIVLSEAVGMTGDPDADVAIAVLTTANRSIVDMVRRFAPLTDSIRRAGRACPPSPAARLPAAT